MLEVDISIMSYDIFVDGVDGHPREDNKKQDNKYKGNNTSYKSAIGLLLLIPEEGIMGEEIDFKDKLSNWIHLFIDLFALIIDFYFGCDYLSVKLIYFSDDYVSYYIYQSYRSWQWILARELDLLISLRKFLMMSLGLPILEELCPSSPHSSSPIFSIGKLLHTSIHSTSHKSAMTSYSHDSRWRSILTYLASTSISNFPLFPVS